MQEVGFIICKEKAVRIVIFSVFLISILFLSSSENAFAMLISRESGEMKTDSKGFIYVNVGRDGRLIKFDRDGKFIEELKGFTVEKKPIKPFLFDIDRQDNFWFINKENGRLSLLKFSPNGKFINKVTPTVLKRG